MKLLVRIIFVFFLINSQANSEEVSSWLYSELDKILNLYKNDNISNVERFQSIEKTINQNFASVGIAKFVAGKAWASATKETKKEYIELFKRHLALNIASMMKGYSNQSYSLMNVKHDKTNDVILIDMEIQSEVNKILITWRIKKSKNRFYIIDMLVADISLVVTKRSEFNSMLKKVDYDLNSLNNKLRAQNNSSYNSIIE